MVSPTARNRTIMNSGGPARRRRTGAGADASISMAIVQKTRRGPRGFARGAAVTLRNTRACAASLRLQAGRVGDRSVARTAYLERVGAGAAQERERGGVV